MDIIEGVDCNINNIVEAMEISGTKAVDASSGHRGTVTGIKSIELMDLFA